MQVTGSVLADDGTPLEGLAVSDGRAWTITGNDGWFSLAAATGRPVWARRPAPWPGGRWWACPAGEPITLRLRRRARGSQAEPARLAHLSDPHISTMGGDARQAVELAAR